MVKWRNNKGFTLMEVLISIAMIGILFLPLLTFFSHGAEMNTHAKGMQRANEVAVSVMEEARAYDTLDAMNTAGYLETSSGSGVYSKVITGLQNDNKHYTAKVDVDVSTFKGLNQEKIYSIAPLGAGSTVMAAEGDSYTQNVITEYQARLNTKNIQASFSEVATHLQKKIIVEITDQKFDSGVDILSGNYVNVRIYSQYKLSSISGSGDLQMENVIYNENVDFSKLKGIYIFYDYDITNTSSANIFQGIDVKVDMKDSDRSTNPLDSKFTLYALCQQLYNAESKSSIIGADMDTYAATNTGCKTHITVSCKNSDDQVGLFSNFPYMFRGTAGSGNSMNNIVDKIQVDRLAKVTVSVYEGDSVSAGKEIVTLESTRGE